MDLGMHDFLWSGTALGYLAAIGLVVAAIAFGVLIVRPWQDPPERE
jgi:UPF0716 family protein affecting phage T7 exclusion